MIRELVQSLPLFVLAALCAHAALKPGGMDAIRSGVPWYDQNGRIVSARGAGVIREGGRHYLFGEFKQDHGNAFVGFACYSSPDLVNWTFESVALPAQTDGRLGPGRVGERPKVMKCPATGEFVMYMHTDDARYRDPAVGYATSPSITGPYIFRGPLLFNGAVVKKWDMGVFQDDDGSGYLITHSGNLYALADDYKSVTRQVVKDMTPGCESPAIFKRDGLYYWLGSGLTAWERNDNYYFIAASLAGPWERQGVFAPEGTLTWNSQTTFVLPVVGSETTTYMFMGDRWAHPRQNSAATYVWQPLRFDAAGKISLPTFHPGWRVDAETGRWSLAEPVGKIIDLRDDDRMTASEKLDTPHRRRRFRRPPLQRQGRHPHARLHRLPNRPPRRGPLRRRLRRSPNQGPRRQRRPHFRHRDLLPLSRGVVKISQPQAHARRLHAHRNRARRALFLAGQTRRLRQHRRLRLRAEIPGR